MLSPFLAALLAKVALLTAPAAASVLGALPVYLPFQGGTGTSTIPTSGQMLIGDGSGRYSLVASSSLGSLPTSTSFTSLTTTNLGFLSGATSTSGYCLQTTASGTVFNGVCPSIMTQTYMFTSSTSDVSSTYHTLTPLDLYSAGGLASITTNVGTSPTLMGVFVTSLGFPNASIIPVGTFTIHFDTIKSAGANNYYTYAELYKVSTLGVETLLETSDISTQSAVNTVVNQTITGLVTSTLSILSTDRVIVKIYGVLLSASANVTLRYDDATSARLELPLASPDTTTFLPYVGAVTNTVMGAYGLNAAHLNITTLSSSSVLYTGTDGLVTGNSTSLYFDGTRLGVNTSTPREALTVNGNGFLWNTATGTTSFIVRAGTSQSLSVVPWVTEVQLNNGTQISGVRADGLTASKIFSTQDIVTAAIAQVGEGYSNGLNLYNSGLVSWSNLGFWYQTKDLGISRGATGTLYVGNGNQGSATGTLVAGNIGVGTTTPIAQLSVQGIAGTDGIRYSSTTPIFVARPNGNVGIGTASPSESLEIAARTKFGTIAYAGAAGSYVNDNNLPIQIIGNAAQYGVSRTANTYGLLFGAYNANTYSMRVVEASNNLAFIVNNTTQALTVTSAGNVGIATTSPQAALVIGAQGGSIADGNVPLQLSTGVAGTQSNIGINKNGAYGFLLGYMNNTALGGIGLWQGSYFRNVTADPFAIVMNSTNVSSLWNSAGDVALGGNVTNSSTFDGAKLVVRATGNIGIGTSTPIAQLSSQTAAGVIPFEIASSTGSSILRVDKTSNVVIGVPTGVPVNAAKLVVRGDGGDLYAIENSAGVRQLTLAETGAATYAGTIRINGGQIINGSTSDALLYTLTAGTAWSAIANVSTSPAFNIAGPNSGPMNNNFLQVSSNWNAPNAANVFVINKQGYVGVNTSTPTEGFSVATTTFMAAGQIWKYTPTTAATYSLLKSDFYISVSSTENYSTTTLPLANSVKAGTTFKIKDRNPNDTSVPRMLTQYSDTLDLVASTTPFDLAQGQAIEVVSNGISNWEINY
jgi:hypothetical protein